ncbi:MAG: TIGR03546 family protein [Elusimicrobia bacterium]|nr:TIGR03546 family protein [Elusimicrobiota bacterium]
MLLLIKILKKTMAILNSNATPSQIAGGVVLGSFIGLAPFFCLHKLFVFLLIIFLNVNMGSAFLSILIFSVIGLLVDPLAHQIGYALLVKTSALADMWTALYNMPIVPFTRFYNTIILGSFVIALILILPVFFGTKKFVVYYREHLAKKVENWKIIKVFKLSGFYKLYSKFSD